MRQLLAITLLFAATTVHAQERRPGSRQHFTVSAPNGKTFPMTELLTHPSSPQTKMTTLVEGDRGQRFLFVYNDDVVEKTTTVEFRHLNTGRFLRGTFRVDYPGTTLLELRAARERLKPEDYDVPFTIETNSFRGTQRLDGWRFPEGARLRAELGRHVQGDLMSSLGAARVVLTSGSPAVSMFCRMLLAIAVPGQDCKRNRELVKAPVDDGCAFDAQFGYPCTD